MKKGKKIALVLACVCGAVALTPLTGCSFSKTTDYEGWSTRIAEEAISASVYVEKKDRTTEGTVVSQGSGVIFYENATHYYLLTNNHVVQKATGSLSTTYSVYDCYDNVYTAGIYQNCTSSEYDLALIWIEKGEADLSVLPIAEKNPDGLQPLAAIGTPEGRHNSVTFGKTVGYEAPQGIDSTASQVDFPALVHTCYTAQGSSGGAIINTDLQIVGVHFACKYVDEEYASGYAIPAVQIRECMTLEWQIASGS